jgi:DNA-binding XRE family transcriptional regulator
MTEHLKAKSWRERHSLTVADLSELTGYSPEAIYCFERGLTASRTRAGSKKKRDYAPGPIPEEVWFRYKRICQGVQAHLDGRKFQW